MSNTKKDDLPAMPFYVGDWLKCPEVRSLPPDYRGLWFDLICFMWESTERGVMVKPNNKPYTDSEIVRMVGLDNQNSGIWLTVLIENNVCSRRDDGAIYSRKMVKMQEIRAVRAFSGRLGGFATQFAKANDQANSKQNIEYENESINKGVVRGKPTLEAVQEYFKERKTKIDPVVFHSYYEANGWVQGRNKPIKNWKVCLNTWERNGFSNENKPVVQSAEKRYEETQRYLKSLEV